jgi:hypothetical protein
VGHPRCADAGHHAQDQHLVILTPEAGGPDEGAMRLLAVLGTQRMDADR